MRGPTHRRGRRRFGDLRRRERQPQRNGDRGRPAEPYSARRDDHHGMRLPGGALPLGVQTSIVLLLLGCSQAPSAAQPSPTSDPAIKAYQALMLSDDTTMGASTSNHCNTVQDTGCPAAVARVVTTLQTWLDDLNRFQTPARFATIDVQMK